MNVVLLGLTYLWMLSCLDMVLCFFCFTRPTFSLLPVVIALMHISTLMTHNYVIVLLLTCVSPTPQPWCYSSTSWTDECAAIGWYWTPTRQISSFSGCVSKTRRQTFTPSNSVLLTFSYQLPSHIWESSLTMSWRLQHTSNAWTDCDQHRQLRTVRHALSVEAAWTLVNAFVISHVDCCNSIFGSTNAVHLRSLQCVLIAAVRLIVKRRKFDHITNSLRDELQWLSVQYRHTYKICLLVYKCLHGTAHCTSSSNAYRLRSTLLEAVYGLLPTT